MSIKNFQMKNNSEKVPPVLEARKICKNFRTPRGTLEVLKSVTLQISEGEFISIRGESGSGKTTLLQILGGLDSVTSGELFWSGKKISDKKNTFLAKHRARWLGYVFQAFYLVPELTALENIILAGRIAGKSAKEVTLFAKNLLDRVGLAERAAHLPSQLSGGECQRVALARALINKPRLILADEPTGNLDEHTGEEIMRLLLTLSREEKVALILVTHNTDFAQRADRELILRHGEILTV